MAVVRSPPEIEPTPSAVKRPTEVTAMPDDVPPNENAYGPFTLLALNPPPKAAPEVATRTSASTDTKSPSCFILLPLDVVCGRVPSPSAGGTRSAGGERVGSGRGETPLESSVDAGIAGSHSGKHCVPAVPLRVYWTLAIVQKYNAN